MDVTKGGNKWGNKVGGRGRREGREREREGRKVTKKPHITIANSASGTLFTEQTQTSHSFQLRAERKNKTPEENLPLSFLSGCGNETVFLFIYGSGLV